MTGQKRRGVAPTTTPNNIYQNESYQDYASKASGNFKEKAVELLLFLQNPLPLEVEMVCWSQFKTWLSQFYDIQEKQSR